MGTILNMIAAALIVIWAVEYFGYDAGYGIHILLGVAILILLLKIILGFTSRERTLENPYVQNDKIS